MKTGNIKSGLLVTVLCFIYFISALSYAQTGMKAGAAKIDITPAIEDLPSNFKSIRDNIYVRAIVIESKEKKAALVAADVAGFPDPIWEEITKRVETEAGIPVPNVLLCASHSHSVPFLAGDGMGRPATPAAKAYTKNVAESIVKAIHQAIEKLQPARIGFGTGTSYMNVNRDVIDPETRLWTQGPNYQGPSDKTVAVVKIENLKGEPFAVFYNFAVHANALFMTGVLSSCIPGETSKNIEETYGNKVIALWSTGAAGDQNPMYHMPSISPAYSSRRNPGPLPQNMSVEPNRAVRQSKLVSSIGFFLGEEIVRVLQRTKRTYSDIDIGGYRTTVTCPGRKRTDQGGREGGKAAYEDGMPVNIRLGLLMVGDIAFTSVNGEAYNSIAQRLKKDSPYANTMFLSITNGRANSGYIPSDDAFGRSTFQVLGSRLKPGCAEDAIINGILDMMDKDRK